MSERRELRRAKAPVHVEPQVFDLLVYLVNNRDRVVRRNDLMASVWGGRNVSDSTLTSRIYAVRNAVGDHGEDKKLVRTIARKGFQLCRRELPHAARRRRAGAFYQSAAK